MKETITKSVNDLLSNPAVIVEMCKGDQIVALTRDDLTEMILVSKTFFNELVEKANKSEMYFDLWQAEVAARQGKMISAKQVLEEIEHDKK